MINRCDWKDRETRALAQGRPFISIDPGAHGYAMAWQPHRSTPLTYCHALEPRALFELVRELHSGVIVLEEQFVYSLKNAHIVLDLSFCSGIALGAVAALAAERRGTVLDVFEVNPATWQAHQRKALGKPKAAKGDALRWALGHGQELFAEHAEWQQADRKQREGMASALGIGEWWRSLCA